MIRKITLAVLFLTVSLVANGQFSQPTDASDCTTLFFKALLDEDSKGLENLLSTDFSVTSFDGQLIDRSMLMDAIAQGILSVDSGMLSGMRTRNYGDVAVVTGNWNVSAQMQNNRFNNEVAYMLVSVKTGGNWKVSAVQFTPIR